MPNFSHITSPLDQFEILNPLNLDAPIFDNLLISLSNIGLYLTIGAFSVLIASLLATNYNKVISNSWSISLAIHVFIFGIAVFIIVVGSDILSREVIPNPLFIYYMGVCFYATSLSAIFLLYNNYDRISGIFLETLDIVFNFIINNPFTFFRGLIIFMYILSLALCTLSPDNLNPNDLALSTLSAEGMCNPQDVDPIHENRINSVYQKLARLAAGGDNVGRTMNSKNLINGLHFDPRDRVTMHTQITNAHPNMMFRFINTDTPERFSYPRMMSYEILDLFRPTNP